MFSTAGEAFTSALAETEPEASSGITGQAAIYHVMKHQM